MVWGRRASLIVLAALVTTLFHSVAPTHAQVVVSAWLVTGRAERWNAGSCSAGAGQVDDAAGLTPDGLARRFAGTNARLLVPDVYVAPYDGGMLVGDEAVHLVVRAEKPAAPVVGGLEVVVDVQRIKSGEQVSEDRILFVGRDRPWIAWTAHPVAAGSDHCLVVRVRCAAGEPGMAPQLGSFTVPEEHADEPPRLEKRVDPNYPKKLFQATKEGRVVIKAFIDETGRVASAQVLRAPDPALTMAALDAVIRWRYAPARKAGVPVPAFFTAITTFRKP